MKYLTKSRTWTDPSYGASSGKMTQGHVKCEEPLQARVICDSGQDLAKYRLDIGGVQDVSRENGGTVRATDYTSYN